MSDEKYKHGESVQQAQAALGAAHAAANEELRAAALWYAAEPSQAAWSYLVDASTKIARFKRRDF